MKNNELSTGRRNFLKIFGAGLSGTILSPVAAQGAKLRIGNRKARIGLLLPNSSEHPAYPKSFLKGLQMGLNQHNSVKKGKIELITEQVNFGTPLITKEKTTKLINENDVDVLVGVLNSEVCTHISSVVSTHKIPFILANAGENHPVAEIRNNPFIFLNHLGLYQSNYRLGEMMVNSVGKRAFIVTSFYDGGYDALFSFRQGVETAGGEVIDTAVQQTGDKDFKEKIVDKIKALQPDFVFVFMNGRPAFDFINLYGLSGQNIPLAVSNFVLEENRKHELGNINTPATSVTSWHNCLNTGKNKKFISEFEKENHYKPDSFALLGYETGIQVYTVLSEMSPDFSGETFMQSLSALQTDSPRGILGFERETGILEIPLFSMECNNTGNYELKNTITGEMNPLKSSHEDFAALDTDLRSGWLNPYLFV